MLYSAAASATFAKIVSIIVWSLPSTSSNVQDNLSEFCDISSAEVATPPALDALPGANRMPFSCKYSVASIVVGLLIAIRFE